MTSFKDIELPPKPSAAAEVSRCVDALAQDPKVSEIWIFGSRARGTPSLDSDVDLVVVREEGENSPSPSRMGLDAARRISRLKLSLPVEAVVVSKET